MKKLIAVTLNCLIFLTASGSVFADNILLFGDRPGDRAVLQTSLEALGHTVTNDASLPVDLSGFDTVWHVGAFVPLPPGDQAILATFLASGGGVHLTGERPCCEDLNDSLENFINTVVVGGGIQVGDLGDIGGPYVINPAALNGLADTPNTVSLWSPSAPGGMGGLGNLPDANILTTGAGDVPVGGAWAGGDLVSGDGQLTLLMDVDWFSDPLEADNLAFVENIQTFLNGDFVPTGVARFLVTKTFSDGREDLVKVTLTCNTGLPLEQDFMIAGGDDGVMFVVTNLLGGNATCEVTESGGPDGYTTIMNGGNGCVWEGVEGGVRVCEITNVAQDATFTVYKDWDIFNDGGDAVVQAANVTIYCNNPIDGGVWDGEYFTLSDTLVGDGAYLTAEVDTTERSAECWADENQAQSGVVADTSDCGERTIVAGGSSSCRIVNTVFFEGIPTLSQYGLAIMALLMLGVGFIGFRRFV